MAQTAFYSKAQHEKAARLMAVADKWAEGTRKRDGLRYNVFTSDSAPGVFYYTRIDGAACTCPAARLSRSGRCYHKLACQLVTERVQHRPAPAKTYEEVYGLVDAF